MAQASHLAASHFAHATMETKAQTLEMIQLAVKGILGRTNCPTCGRIAEFNMTFAVDPGPDLAKAGVVSLTGQGF